MIIDNCAEFGGAIFQYQHSLHLYNSIIEYNYAADSGGAIFALYANAYMYDSYITCNDAEIFGGGFFDYRSEARIYESTAISDNMAQFANEFYCNLATVHVDTVNGGTVYDNDINNLSIKMQSLILLEHDEEGDLILICTIDLGFEMHPPMFVVRVY